MFFSDVDNNGDDNDRVNKNKKISIEIILLCGIEHIYFHRKLCFVCPTNVVLCAVLKIGALSIKNVFIVVRTDDDDVIDVGDIQRLVALLSVCNAC